MNIERVRGLEILDSRGNPTVMAEVTLDSGIRSAAHAPSGASTGRHEAFELRDGGERYGGKGTTRAARHIDTVLGPLLAGLNILDQRKIDTIMTEADGTRNKSRLGANAILAVSCAVARAAARSEAVPLWRYLAGERQAVLPVPMVNVISGGLHAGRNLDFQDFLVIPRGGAGLSSSLEAVVRVHRAAERILRERGCVLTGVADEGGWGPLLDSSEQAVAILREAISTCGASMDIALDIAASHFSATSAGSMTELLGRWISEYGISSIEDPLSEDDWEGWRSITRSLGPRVQLVGDDLFATNPERLAKGIRDGVANAVLVKMNQIGTLTETFQVIDQARSAGYAAVISARSGETEDAFLADLAMASGAGQIKIGSITRSERLAKYNRLLEIERWELG